MLILTKPVLVDGAAPEGDADQWHDENDVVDMDLVAENFRRLYLGVNGGLHASNLSTGVGDVSIDERLVRFSEFADNHAGATLPIPGSGMSHSHDGIDSSRLGPGAVNMNVTQRKSLGAWRTPTKGRTLYHYWGIAPITISNIPEWGGSSGDNENYTVYIEIPYDTHQLPRTWKLKDTTTGVVADSARVFVTVQNLNPLTRAYIKVRNAKVTKLSSLTNQAMYLQVVLNVRENTAPISNTDGLFLHWAIFALLRPVA